MKRRGRTKASDGAESSGPQLGTPDHNFYEAPPSETPIVETSSRAKLVQGRTSLHSPARRREASNRASDKALIGLVVRFVVIVVLLGGGFVALKMVLGRMQGPTEKELERRALSAKIMEKGGLNIGVSQTALTMPSSEQTQELFVRWIEVDRHLRSANGFYQRGMLEEAVVPLRKVLRLVPENTEAKKILLTVQIQLQQYEEAAALALQLLSQNSEQWPIKMDLLTALFALGDATSCLKLADLMLGQEPADLNVLEVAAEAHRSLGDWEDALSRFQQMLEHDAQHQIALVGAGEIYQEQGDIKRATLCYLELVRFHPKEKYYRQLAHCYSLQGESGKAIIFMGQAASLYGEGEVSSWLRSDLEMFDPIRESVEYRSFADRMVGEETRMAIESIRLREVEKKEERLPEVDLPGSDDLKLKPGQ